MNYKILEIKTTEKYIKIYPLENPDDWNKLTTEKKLKVLLDLLNSKYFEILTVNDRGDGTFEKL
jgi:hypothetical protein